MKARKLFLGIIPLLIGSATISCGNGVIEEYEEMIRDSERGVVFAQECLNTLRTIIPYYSAQSLSYQRGRDVYGRNNFYVTLNYFNETSSNNAFENYHLVAAEEGYEYTETAYGETDKKAYVMTKVFDEYVGIKIVSTLDGKSVKLFCTNFVYIEETTYPGLALNRFLLDDADYVPQLPDVPNRAYKYEYLTEILEGGLPATTLKISLFATTYLTEQDIYNSARDFGYLQSKVSLSTGEVTPMYDEGKAPLAYPGEDTSADYYYTFYATDNYVKVDYAFNANNRIFYISYSLLNPAYL